MGKMVRRVPGKGGTSVVAYRESVHVKTRGRTTPQNSGSTPLNPYHRRVAHCFFQLSVVHQLWGGRLDATAFVLDCMVLPCRDTPSCCRRRGRLWRSVRPPCPSRVVVDDAARLRRVAQLVDQHQPALSCIEQGDVGGGLPWLLRAVDLLQTVDAHAEAGSWRACGWLAGL